MAEERVDIVINDRIAPTLVPRLRLIATVTNQAAQGVAGLNTAIHTVRPVSNRIPKSMNAVSTSTNKATHSFLSMGVVLRTMFQVYFAYAAAQRILEMADAYKQMSNRLTLVTDSAEQANEVLGALYASAQRSRSDLASSVTAFQRFDLAFKELGRSQADTLQLTETVSKMLQLTGSTATEASSGLLQLSQAFNKGKLDGDEFRTVMETMPLVARALADKLDITKKEMYRMAEAGELTADILSDAILASTEDVDRAFGDLNKTLGQSVTQLQNNVLVAFGDLNEKLGGTDGLVSTIDKITDSIDYLVLILESVFQVMSNMDVLTNNFGGMFNWVKPAMESLSGLDMPDMATSMVMAGKYAEYMGAVKAGATGGEILQMQLEMYDLAALGVKGLIAKMRRERSEMVGGRPAGEGATNPEDETPFTKRIRELRLLNDTYRLNNGLMDDNLAIMTVYNSMQKKGLALTREQVASLYNLLDATRYNKIVAETVQDVYDNNAGAMRELTAEMHGLNLAYELGFMSTEQYMLGQMQVASDMQHVKTAMMEVRNVGDGLNVMWESMHLGVLQLAADLPLVFESIADSITDSLQRMTDGIGDLIAQWAVFGEKMRFIDVFREVVAQMISTLVSLATQYMIVGLMRQFAGMGGSAISGSITSGGGSSFTSGGLNLFGGQQSMQPFYNGGYTGGIDKHAVAGAVHGKEFVVNARATARNRSALEAMNSGGSMVPSVVINNNAPGVTVRAEAVSADEVRFICEETVSKRAGGAVARDISNPNSAVSRSMRSNTTAGRRGV